MVKILKSECLQCKGLTYPKIMPMINSSKELINESKELPIIPIAITRISEKTNMLTYFVYFSYKNEYNLE